MLCFFSFVFMAGVVASLDVTVPDKQLKAIRGHAVILGCTFTPDPDISNLVITWQRKEDSQVVHSFYYQQDQLDRQSMVYQSRTFLFKSELAKGNASLGITSVRQEDAGGYMCVVTNALGSGRASVELIYGALYSEPRLSIYINSSAFIVNFETEGFPKAEVNWLGEQGEDLIHHLEVTEKTEGGLYFIKSSYAAQGPMINVTFKLNNYHLNQKLERPVVLTYDEVTTIKQAPSAVIVLSILCVMLFICIIVLIFRRRKIQKSSPRMNT